MAVRDVVAVAEALAVEIGGMTDEELREAARRMVGPFMHELASRGCSYALHSEDFVSRAGARARHH